MTSNHDPSVAINNFLRQTDAAAQEIASSRNYAVTGSQVRESLVLACHVEQQLDLLPLALSAKRIGELLADFDFQWLTPLAEISFEHSILPARIPRRVDEVQAKHSNEIWRVHKCDADPFPSNPHAHNVDTGYKLHLGNGGLYNKRVQIGAIRRKDLLSIREKLRGIALPALDQGNG